MHTVLGLTGTGSEFVERVQMNARETGEELEKEED